MVDGVCDGGCQGVLEAWPLGRLDPHPGGRKVDSLFEVQLAALLPSRFNVRIFVEVDCEVVAFSSGSTGESLSEEWAIGLALVARHDVDVERCGCGGPGRLIEQLDDWAVTKARASGCILPLWSVDIQAGIIHVPHAL